MPNLFLRDIPDELFNKMKACASGACCSMPALAIKLLAEVLEHDERRKKHREAMNSIIARARLKQQLPIDSLTMLHEDRNQL